MKKANPRQEVSLNTQLDNITKDASFAAQRHRLIQALERAPVTTLQAREDLNIMHPAGRVKELRQDGKDIVCVIEWITDSAGRKHKAGKYFLVTGS